MSTNRNNWHAAARKPSNWKGVNVPSPFLGEIFTIQNPDDSEVTLHGWGDPCGAVFETLDGHTAVQGNDCSCAYAELTSAGEVLVTGDTRPANLAPTPLPLAQLLFDSSHEDSAAPATAPFELPSSADEDVAPSPLPLDKIQPGRVDSVEVQAAKSHESSVAFPK